MPHRGYRLVAGDIKMPYSCPVGAQPGSDKTVSVSGGKGVCRVKTHTHSLTSYFLTVLPSYMLLNFSINFLYGG